MADDGHVGRSRDATRPPPGRPASSTPEKIGSAHARALSPTNSNHIQTSKFDKWNCGALESRDDRPVDRARAAPSHRVASDRRNRFVQGRRSPTGVHAVGDQPADREPRANRRHAGHRARARPKSARTHAGGKVAARAHGRDRGAPGRGQGRHRRVRPRSGGLASNRSVRERPETTASGGHAPFPRHVSGRRARGRRDARRLRSARARSSEGRSISPSPSCRCRMVRSAQRSFSTIPGSSSPRRGGDRTALSRLTLREIAELPLVCWHSPLPIAPALDSFRAAGIEPNIVLRSDYNEVVQGFAAAGFGVALMPRLAVNPCDCRTAIVDLDGLIPPRRLAIASHRDRATNDAIDAFVLARGRGRVRDRRSPKGLRSTGACPQRRRAADPALAAAPREEPHVRPGPPRPIQMPWTNVTEGRRATLPHGVARTKLRNRNHRSRFGHRIFRTSQ